MNDLTQLLPAILRATEDSAEVLEAAVFAAWRRVSGAGLRDYAVPFRLYGRTLVVAVSDNTWRDQMEDMSGQILFRLNSILGQPAVTFIEFRVDPHTVEKSRFAQRRREMEQEEQERRALASAEVLQPAAACIKNEELRRKFLLAAGSCIDRLNRDARR